MRLSLCAIPNAPRPLPCCDDPSLWSITQTRATYMVVCVECLPVDKPWDVVSVTRRSSGVAPRACVRVYARVLVPPNLYIHTYIQPPPARTLTLSLSLQSNIARHNQSRFNLVARGALLLPCWQALPQVHTIGGLILRC